MKSIVIRKIPDEVSEWYASQAKKAGMPLETYMRFRLIETARKEQLRLASPDEPMFSSYLLPGRASK